MNSLENQTARRSWSVQRSGPDDWWEMVGVAQREMVGVD